MATKNTVSDRGERLSATEDFVDDHHGQSVAAWTSVGILLVAAALICLSFPLASVRTPLLAVGIGLAVAGLVAGKVLASTGYGIAGKGEVTDIADAPDTANRDDVGIS